MLHCAVIHCWRYSMYSTPLLPSVAASTIISPAQNLLSNHTIMLLHVSTEFKYQIYKLKYHIASHIYSLLCYVSTRVALLCFIFKTLHKSTVLNFISRFIAWECIVSCELHLALHVAFQSRIAPCIVHLDILNCSSGVWLMQIPGALLSRKIINL